MLKIVLNWYLSQKNNPEINNNRFVRLLMLKTIFEIIAGILVLGILSLFVFIDLIHAYCRKHVDNNEDKRFETEK